MREILRLEFEHASHIAREAGNSEEALRFLQLAETVQEIDLSLLEAYSELSMASPTLRCLQNFSVALASRGFQLRRQSS
jgi:hypothetical protein